MVLSEGLWAEPVEVGLGGVVFCDEVGVVISGVSSLPRLGDTLGLKRDTCTCTCIYIHV